METIRRRGKGCGKTCKKKQIIQSVRELTSWRKVAYPENFKPALFALYILHGLEKCHFLIRHTAHFFSTKLTLKNFVSYFQTSSTISPDRPNTAVLKVTTDHYYSLVSQMRAKVNAHRWRFRASSIDLRGVPRPGRGAGCTGRGSLHPLSRTPRGGVHLLKNFPTWIPF